MNSDTVKPRRLPLTAALVAALLSLSGCESAEEKAKRVGAEKKAAAEKALKIEVDQKVSSFKMNLVDPNSAMFSELTLYEDGTLCGKVNSKNRMGGYAGFSNFAYKDGMAMIRTEATLPKVYSDGMDWGELEEYQAATQVNKAIADACVFNESPVKYRG